MFSLITFIIYIYIIYIYIAMATGRSGHEFRYPIPIPIPILIPKLNEYQTFVSSSSLLTNGYNLVPIPIFLLLQY